MEKDRGENWITFKVSSEGKVRPAPEYFVKSTSFEMESLLTAIANEAAQFIEDLLKKKMKESAYLRERMQE